MRTSRLQLRRTEESDFKFFLPLDLNPAVMKFIRAAAQDEDEARVRFERLLTYNGRFSDRGAYTAFTHEGEFIGFGFLVHIEMNPDNKDLEVGYRLSPEAWGKGYATEIARALLEYGFDKLQLNTIYATTHPDHVVSQKVLQKAGMNLVGPAPYYNGTTLFRLDR